MLQQQPMWVKTMWALLLIAPLLIYGSTVLSLEAIWSTSDTFAHGYFILPISLWLIWQQRDSLLQLSAKPAWWALPPLLLCGFGWLLADLAEVQVIAQYAFVLLFPLLVLLLLGNKISFRIKFPLAFLLLAVPFGEVLIPALIEFTADFTVTAVQLTGIPVVRDGVRFSTPTGNWIVVEECSGLRYLIASFTLGSLYAYLTYRTWWRQLLCVLLSIVVPIVANGLRAYMIVLIGHFSGMKLAVGVDHLIYGWLFFGLVMLLFFWVGSFWREDDLPVETSSSADQSAVSAASPKQLMAAAVAALCCLLVWPLYGQYLQKINAQAEPAKLQPLLATQSAPSIFTDWQPHLLRSQARSLEVIQGQTQPVALFAYYYRQQHAQSKLISASNTLIADARGEWVLKQQQGLSDQPLPVLESQLHSPQGDLLVWQTYWIDGQFTHSNYVGKLLQARSMLLHQSDDGAHLIFVTPITTDVAQAREQLAVVAQQHLSTIKQGLTATQERR